MSRFTDNRQDCTRCDEYIEDGELAYSIQYTYWNASDSSFEDEPQTSYYCSDCWNEIRPERSGTELEIRNTEQLWGILDASKGDLVADFGTITVGARPYIQVLDGTPFVASVKARRAGDDVVQFYTSFEEKDREWFDETVQSYKDEDLPTIVRIKSEEETPFNDFPDREGEQETLFQETEES